MINYINHQKSALALLCLVCLSFACTKSKNSKNEIAPTALFSLVSADQTNIDFTNRSIESPERNLSNYDYFYNGSGVAIGDLNNDGLADIFFAGNDSSNKLYVNQGDFSFSDQSESAGIQSHRWSTGVSLIDINEDGFLDIYVCNSGPYSEDKMLANELYINNGDLTFTEKAKEYGIADPSYSSQASFFDYDKDGDLDLFVMNHSLITYERQMYKWFEVLEGQDEHIQQKSSSTLFRNDGNNRFTDVTKSAGLYRPGFGLGLAISDFDENGQLDIYVANDYFIPDFMFFNNGDGTFSEEIASKVSHTSFFSMGCDAADFNNDQLIDLSVVDMTPADHYRGKTQMESMDTDKFSYLVNTKDYIPQYMFNTLNLNRSKGNFSEIAHFSGVATTDWSWSTLLVDLDNDSWKDMVVTNGFKRDTRDRDWINALNKRYELEGRSEEVIYDQLQKSKSTPVVNYLFRNKGDLQFENYTKNWGFNEPSFSQGAAYGDLDNDGDLDLVINNLEDQAFVYRNNTPKSNGFVQISLTDNGSSTKAMHSKIKLFHGGQVQLLEYSFVRGYLSQMQPIAHFGIGTTSMVDKLEIHWPDGTLSVMENPTINTHHFLDKMDLKSVKPIQEPLNLSFMDIASRLGLSQFKHKENNYDDYKDEVLLPHKQSTLGPALTSGDINGDGLDDFFVGGAKGQAGHVYLQNKKKGFVKSLQVALEKDASFEDLGALLFDVDADGDLDLYVASGGGEFSSSPELLQDRIYINLGGGTFKRSNQLPTIRSSTATVLATDWDLDGDLDVFVGGRTTAGNYPLPPESYLLRNDNGKFTNITSESAPELKEIGMITGAIWSDLNKDGRHDLLVVGEWMPIKVFINTQNGFVDATEEIGLNNESGWWYSINSGDFDNDGDEDFIVGNLGLNNKFHASSKKPLHIFSNDFDKNGSVDIVLSKLYNDDLAPVRGKDCSTAQMPSIAQKFPSFSEFASASLGDIYGEQNLQEALHYEATSFESIYLENKNNTLIPKRLPLEAQLSPIKDMVIWDFDKDGNLDLVIGGNKFNTEVETPAYDAGKGLFLKGNGDGTFVPHLSIEESGIFMPLNVKQMELLFILKEKRPAILVANNNNFLNLITWIK